MADHESQAPTNAPKTPADPVGAALSGAKATVDELQAQLTGSGSRMKLPEFADGRIEMLGDVDLDVTIELGRTEMVVEDVLRLDSGAVVELDKLAGDPVDVHVNGRLVARGEVLVLNDNFCIRISEIVANLEEEAREIEAQAAAQSNE